MYLIMLDFVKSKPLLERAVLWLMLGDSGQLDASTCAKATYNLHPCWGDGGNEVIQNAVDNLLVEGGVVAVGREVVLEALRFNACFSGAVSDGEMAAIGLSRDRAESAKLMRVEHDGVGALRAAVGEAFKFGFFGGVEEGRVAS